MLFEEKVKTLVKNIVLTTMTKIEVKSGLCRYNYRCQLNAVHDALNNNQDEIAMCFYFHNGYPIIHFINIDDKGNYVDNTLGQWSQTFDYYLIKRIKRESFLDIDDVFTSYREEIKSKLPWYVKLFNDCEF